MLTIKKETKRGQNLIDRSKTFKGTRLEDVYSSYSQAKLSAWQDCYNKYLEEDGNNFHIISFNTFGFSVAWEVADGVRIETPQNSYKIA